MSFGLDDHFEIISCLSADLRRDTERFVGARHRAAARLEAHVDACRIEGARAQVAAFRVVCAAREVDDRDRVAGALLFLVDQAAPEFVVDAIDHLVGLPSAQQFMRLAFRFSPFPRVVAEIRARVKRGARPWAAAEVEALALHRMRGVAGAPPSPRGADEMASEPLLVAAGRLRAAVAHGYWEEWLVHRDESAVSAALEAAAWSGAAGLDRLVSEHASATDPRDAVLRFSGIVGDGSAGDRLANAAVSGRIGALSGLASFGSPRGVPALLEAMRHHPSPCAAAYRQIVGVELPARAIANEVSAAEPEEADFNPISAPLDPDGALEEWRRISHRFDPAKRYQFGLCVSDDPLGPVFDRLPYESQRVVYLRERALRPESTPDWELETWPDRVKNPTWAWKK